MRPPAFLAALRGDLTRRKPDKAEPVRRNTLPTTLKQATDPDGRVYVGRRARRAAGQRGAKR